MPTFDYASAIEELHGFLWRYVHENASVEESHDTVAELLDLAPLDRDRTARRACSHGPFDV